MQEEVRELIPYEWKKEVAKFHRARLETVIRAVVRIQAALRGVLSRKVHTHTGTDAISCI